jgi:PAS domain S-box-containing protein
VLRLNVRALLRLHAAEETRRQASRLLQAVQNSFPTWLAYLNRDLVFVHVNPTFCEAVGKRPEEVIGRQYMEIMPQDEAVMKRLRRVLETGTATRIREVPYRELVPQRRRADRYLEVSLAPVTDESGAVEGVIFSALEVTAEVRLRAAHAEQERRQRELAETLHRETNHRIKNNLMTLAELLHYQAQSLAEEPARAALQDAVARISVFARIHEQLQSVQTDEVGLLDLLQRVASVSGGPLPGRDAEVSVQGEEVYLPTQAATNLALVANELITNGLKHGAPDAAGRRRIVVRLECQTEQLSVRVWSSGNPVPATFDPLAQGGMGLHLVQAMVVRHYGGSFTLRPDEGGTMAQVVVSRRSLTEG